MAEMTYEQAMKRLEEIVKQLESGNTPLESSIKLFEEGVKLSGYCSKLLDNAEQKVKILLENKNGTVSEEDFKGAE